MLRYFTSSFIGLSQAILHAVLVQRTGVLVQKFHGVNTIGLKGGEHRVDLRHILSPGFSANPADILSEQC